VPLTPDEQLIAENVPEKNDAFENPCPVTVTRWKTPSREFRPACGGHFRLSLLHVQKFGPGSS